MYNRAHPQIFAITAVILLWMGCAAALGDVRYVDDDADPCGVGLSWETAYKYLQDALYNAASNPDVNEIRVARGIYKPDMDKAGNVTPGDREATFQLKNGMAIRGGYAGYNDPDPNVCDIRLYETILSGDLDANDVGGLDDTSRDENAYHVVTGANTEPNAVLDGFTITAGKTPGGGGYPSDFGAGMSNVSGSPTVTNCTFTRNYAGWGGGGMFNSYSSSQLTNCVFSENYGGAWGGGIRNDSSSPILTNCTFSGNWASAGGGICSFNSNSTLTNCTFIGNSVPSAPVLMYNVNRSESNDIHPMFLWPPGGGMYNHDSNPTLVNCSFSGNSADYGGGMANNSGTPIITNCTFSDNSARLMGGGMWINNSSTTVNNCILWADSAPTGVEIALSISSTLTVSYSDVQGGWPGIDNIDEDPCFVDANNPNPNLQNLRLKYDSPCIDAGINNAPNIPATDLDGRPRIINGDCDDSAVVDMGAYEFLPADMDGSGAVDLYDLSMLALHWAETACDRCGGANITCDGNVDYNDLRELTDWWLAGIEPEL